MPANARSILSGEASTWVWRTVASCGAVPLFQLHVTKPCKSRKCLWFIASIMNKYSTFYFDSDVPEIHMSLVTNPAPFL